MFQSGPVGINASFSVDGTNVQTNVLSAPPAPNYEIANVSMFDVQELLSGPHTASVTVNDLFGSYSGMIWDYAYVNETLVTTLTPETTSIAFVVSSSSLPSTSTTPSTSTSTSSQYVS